MTPILTLFAEVPPDVVNVGSWQQVWIVLIGAAASVVTAGIAMWGTILLARIKIGQEAAAAEVKTAAKEVREVKATLASSQTTTDGKLDKIHGLVNSAMTAQLRIVAADKRLIAQIRGLPGDAEAARVAEDALAEHLTAQAVIDERSASGVPEAMAVVHKSMANVDRVASEVEQVAKTINQPKET